MQVMVMNGGSTRVLWILGIILIMGMMVKTSEAKVCTWSPGSGDSGDWSVVGNWAGCKTTGPGPTDDVVLPMRSGKVYTVRF